MQRASLHFLFFAVNIFLILFVTPSVRAVELHFARVTCGMTIPIDSQWIFDPMWPVGLPRQRLAELYAPGGPTEEEITFHRRTVSAAVAALLRTDSGMDPRSVVLFEFDPMRRAMPECTVKWNPLLAAMRGTEATAARVMVLNSIGCDESTRLEIMMNGVAPRSLPVKPSDLGAVQSLSFPTGRVRWPVKLHVTANCTVHVLLLTARHGSLNLWYAWIPATVYTALITFLVILASVCHYRVTTGMTSALATLIFLGYIGSCIGLVVELICWQSAMGRMFPFPDSVTFYSCSALLYLMFFIPLFARHPHRGLLARAVLSLAVYGLNCALCCGYWISGLVVIGIVALVQYVAVNMLLTLAYSYFSVILDRSGMIAEPISNSAGILWFAPLTPFTPCALMYYALFVIEENTRRTSAASAGIVEAVTLYNVITDVPALLLVNVWGLALLSAATVYHMPFIVTVFVASLIFSLHALLALAQYFEVRRVWNRRGLFDVSEKKGRCWRTLWPAVEQCVRAARANATQDAEERMQQMASVLQCSTSVPKRQSVFLPSRVEKDGPPPHHSYSTNAAATGRSPREPECFPPSTNVYGENQRVDIPLEYWPASLAT